MSRHFKRPLPADLVELLEQVGRSPADVDGLIPTRRTVYSKVWINNTNTLTAKTDYEVFHAGQGDPLTKLNKASDTNPITKDVCNLLEDGRMPAGELFLCLGIGARYARSVAIGDLEKLELIEVRWGQRSGKEGIIYGMLSEMPSIRGVEYKLGFGGAAADYSRESPTFRGPPFLGRTVLFDIDDNATASTRESLKLRPLVAVSPSGTIDPYIELYGIWFQKPTDG